MIRRYANTNERPLNFQVDLNAPIFQGAVFLGLGQQGYGSTQFYNSANPVTSGTLTGYTGTGNTPVDRWGRAMGRAVLAANGTSDYVACGAGHLPFLKTTAFSGACWVNIPSDTQGSIISNWNVAVTNGWEFAHGEFTASKPALLLTETSGFAYIGKEMDTAVTGTGWRHVGWSYDGSVTSAGITLYLDGQATAATVKELGTKDPGALSDTSLQLFSRRLNNAQNLYLAASMTDAILWRGVTPASVFAQLADPAWSITYGGALVYPRNRGFVGQAGGGSGTAYTDSGTAAADGAASCSDTTQCLDAGTVSGTGASACSDAAQCVDAGTVSGTGASACADAAQCVDAGGAAGDAAASVADAAQFVDAGAAASDATASAGEAAALCDAVAAEGGGQAVVIDLAAFLDTGASAGNGAAGGSDIYRAAGGAGTLAAVLAFVVLQQQGRR